MCSRKVVSVIAVEIVYLVSEYVCLLSRSSIKNQGSWQSAVLLHSADSACSYFYVIYVLDIEAREIDRYTGRKEAVIESSLSPWSIYEFRVTAGNELGYGVPSAPSPQYNTPPDRPYRAPAKVGGGGGKIGDLTIVWEVRGMNSVIEPFVHC